MLEVLIIYIFITLMIILEINMINKYVDSKSVNFTIIFLLLCVFLLISIYFDDIIFYQLINNSEFKNYVIIFESREKSFNFIYIIFIFGLQCQ